MSERPPTTGEREPRVNGRTTRAQASPSTVRRGQTPKLELVVVEYDGRPDRGTIHPPELTGIERMETWLSANTSAFVDLTLQR